jgi:hypothetical protein
MLKSLTLAAALAFAGSTALAAPALSPTGKCRDNGRFVAAALCKPPAKAAKCRDARGKFVKCTAPGAKPVR